MKRFAFLLPALLLFAGCTSVSYDYPGAQREYLTGSVDSAAPVTASVKSKRGRALQFNRAAAEGATDSANFKAPAGRKMTYNTRLVINVSDTVKGVKKASSIAEKHSGYTVYSDNQNANVKVPVSKAAAALKEFETIGSVTSKTITANDITEHYTDTQVRLENLRRLQKRLSELLTRAAKVDDILRIERELSRVTTDLERHQARMNVLNKQVEMVDFNISFNAVITPAETSRVIIPVEWVRSLGDAIRKRKFDYTAVVDDLPVSCELPSGFAVTRSTKRTFCAANADDVVLTFDLVDDLHGANLAFYQQLIEKQLKRIGYTGITFQKSKTASGVEYLAVSAESGRNALAVMVAIYEDGWFCKDKKVSVLELYGPADAMKKIDLNKFYRSIEF